MKNSCKNLVTFLIGGLISSISYAQSFQGSIAKGAGVNQVDVYLKPNFSNASNEFVNGATLAISVPPTAGLVANIAGLGDFSTSTFSPTTETIDGESLFEWVITRNSVPSPYVGWLTGAPFKIATITFAGNTGSPSPTSQVKLLDRTDSTLTNGFFTFTTTTGSKDSLIDKFYSMTGSGTPVIIITDNQYVQTSDAIVLPVTLVNFSAAKAGSAVNINWIVSSETNAKGYDVERSKGNGSAFTAIAHVAATNNGKYNSTDATPLSGANYYRLKMIDIDGKFKYSEVRSVLFDGTTVLFDIYPNPAVTANLYLNLQQYIYTGKSQVIITDLAGRSVQSININVVKGDNHVPVTLNDLNKGTYFVTVYDTKGNVITETKKLVKQ